MFDSIQGLINLCIHVYVLFHIFVYPWTPYFISLLLLKGSSMIFTHQSLSTVVRRNTCLKMRDGVQLERNNVELLMSA